MLSPVPSELKTRTQKIAVNEILRTEMSDRMTNLFFPNKPADSSRGALPILVIPVGMKTPEMLPHAERAGKRLNTHPNGFIANDSLVREFTKQMGPDDTVFAPCIEYTRRVPLEASRLRETCARRTK